MIVLVFGSRNWPDEEAVRAYVRGLPPHAVVVSGMAGGPDVWANDEAVKRGLFVIEVPVHNRHWEIRGRKAGPIRNGIMARLGLDHAAGFSTGTSGTADMRQRLERQGVPIDWRELPVAHPDALARPRPFGGAA